MLISKMMTVGVGHSWRYCNTGYDQSQGRRPSTLKCIGSISQRSYRAPTIRQKLIRIRTADREAMVAPGGTAIPGRPVSRTETKITSQSDHRRSHKKVAANLIPVGGLPLHWLPLHLHGYRVERCTLVAVSEVDDVRRGGQNSERVVRLNVRADDVD